MHTVEAMRAAGCTTHRGIRYWEEQGLLGSVMRSSGDTRYYTDDQLRRAKVIAAAKFGGFDLETIAKMLEAYDAEVYEALCTRLNDQVRAAIRLMENLPQPSAPPKVMMEYDL